MMNEEKRKNRLSDMLLLLIGFAVLVFLYGTDIRRILIGTVPYEIREGACIALVRSLARGVNPYRVLTGQDGMPGVFYMYPILYNAIAAGLVSLTGVSELTALLSLHFLCTLVSGILMAILLYRRTGRAALSIIGMAAMHFCFWRYSNVSLFPDAMAVMWMMLICFLCTGRIEAGSATDALMGTGERISLPRIETLVLLTVLCFHTKQYAVVIALPVMVWLFCRYDIRAAITYVISGILIGGGSILLMHITMPDYYLETILLVGNSADNSIHWMITQFIKMGKWFFPWFLAILLLFTARIRAHGQKGAIRSLPGDYPAVAFIGTGVMLLYFGQNQGAHLSYYLQLWLPYVILLAADAAEAGLKWAERERGQNRKIPKGLREAVITLCITAALILPCIQFRTRLPEAEDRETWKQLYATADTGGTILSDTTLADWALVRDLSWYDHGQNQYLFRREAQPYREKLTSSPLLSRLFRDLPVFYQVHEDYRDTILQNVQNGVYDTIILTPDLGFTRDWQELYDRIDAHYYEQERFHTAVWPFAWETVVWKKKS